jgi:phage gp36-like protein
MLTKHIDRAEAFIASALSGRYSMPFSTVPPDVRRMAEDLASYYVIRASSYQDGKLKNQYLEEYKTVFSDIKAVADGAVKLSYTDGSLVSVKSSAKMLSSSENYTPVFGLDDPEKWQRDADEIEDQAAKR